MSRRYACAAITLLCVATGASLAHADDLSLTADNSDADGSTVYELDTTGDGEPDASSLTPPPELNYTPVEPTSDSDLLSSTATTPSWRSDTTSMTNESCDVSLCLTTSGNDPMLLAGMVGTGTGAGLTGQGAKVLLEEAVADDVLAEGFSGWKTAAQLLEESATTLEGGALVTEEGSALVESGLELSAAAETGAGMTVATGTLVSVAMAELVVDPRAIGLAIYGPTRPPAGMTFEISGGLAPSDPSWDLLTAENIARLRSGELSCLGSRCPTPVQAPGYETPSAGDQPIGDPNGDDVVIADPQTEQQPQYAPAVNAESTPIGDPAPSDDDWIEAAYVTPKDVFGSAVELVTPDQIITASDRAATKGQNRLAYAKVEACHTMIHTVCEPQLQKFMTENGYPIVKDPGIDAIGVIDPFHGVKPDAKGLFEPLEAGNPVHYQLATYYLSEVLNTAEIQTKPQSLPMKTGYVPPPNVLGRLEPIYQPALQVLADPEASDVEIRAALVDVSGQFAELNDMRMDYSESTFWAVGRTLATKAGPEVAARFATYNPYAVLETDNPVSQAFALPMNDGIKALLGD